MTAANAYCARFGADKKTLLSAKRAGFNGGARRVQVAKVGAWGVRTSFAWRGGAPGAATWVALVVLQRLSAWAFQLLRDEGGPGAAIHRGTLVCAGAAH